MIELKNNSKYPLKVFIDEDLFVRKNEEYGIYWVFKPQPESHIFYQYKLFDFKNLDSLNGIQGITVEEDW